MIQKVYPISDRPNNILESLIARLKFSLGFCIVCNKLTGFLKWNTNFRESGICLLCRSKCRHRQIAQVLTKIYKGNHNFTSISRNNLFIYNTESNGVLHRKLLNNKNYISSEYLGSQYKPGQIINEIRHEDLQSLSFDNESFDLILSADVLEHIPNPYQAHSEVFRVLKVGGRHVFTAPFYQTKFLDETRAILNEKNEIEYLKEPIYHIDPMQNYESVVLVYTIFSIEMLCKLSKLGFYTNMYNLYSPFRGMLGNNGIVFESIKVQ